MLPGWVIAEGTQVDWRPQTRFFVVLISKLEMPCRNQPIFAPD
jgi:hypothetical protein